ncbi:hypothetical protein EYR41_002291 [Orbilia oligospora]|uniref:Uncharacterized protein n=1 Tax=Orbilia oligospora TaxID=2813651 RepID=A0A7C8PJI5_ORBOL|nr:hypothetical protein TWF751_006613 [Orbilia oligospora]TGJ62312.1 hypothetical protein EYR41_002291 [Orbilia oligospora]
MFEHAIYGTTYQPLCQLYLRQSFNQSHHPQENPNLEVDLSTLLKLEICSKLQNVSERDVTLDQVIRGPPYEERLVVFPRVRSSRTAYFTNSALKLTQDDPIFHNNIHQ